MWGSRRTSVGVMLIKQHLCKVSSQTLPCACSVHYGIGRHVVCVAQTCACAQTHLAQWVSAQVTCTVGSRPTETSRPSGHRPLWPLDSRPCCSASRQRCRPNMLLCWPQHSWLVLEAGKYWKWSSESAFFLWSGRNKVAMQWYFNLSLENISQIAEEGDDNYE